MFEEIYHEYLLHLNDLNRMHRRRQKERWRKKHDPSKAKKPSQISTPKPTRKIWKIPSKTVAAKTTNHFFGASSICGATLTFIGEKVVERIVQEPEILLLIPRALADILIFLGQLPQSWQAFIYASAFIWILLMVAHRLVMKWI